MRSPRSDQNKVLKNIGLYWTIFTFFIELSIIYGNYYILKLTKLGWNSLMETVRDNTGESNPADIFAAHNEEVQLNLQKELLNEKLAKNEDLKKEIDRKNWEVQMRQKFLEENQKMID